MKTIIEFDDCKEDYYANDEHKKRYCALNAQSLALALWDMWSGDNMTPGHISAILDKYNIDVEMLG